MADQERQQAEWALAAQARQLRDKRLADAVPEARLSSTEDKLLELVRETDGRQFVRRRFRDEAVYNMETVSSLTFEKAWEEMHRLFSADGVKVVPSSLIKTDGYYPYTAVSEYVPNGASMRDAPVELKSVVAAHFGEMLKAPRGLRPSLAMIRHDMYQAVPTEEGGFEAVLLDVDPRLDQVRRFGRRNDSSDAQYIVRVTDLLWDQWSSGDLDERRAVLGAFMKSLVWLIKDGASDQVEEAIFVVHTMAQGLDTRSVR